MQVPEGRRWASAVAVTPNPPSTPHTHMPTSSTRPSPAGIKPLEFRAAHMATHGHIPTHPRAARARLRLASNPSNYCATTHMATHPPAPTHPRAARTRLRLASNSSNAALHTSTMRDSSVITKKSGTMKRLMVSASSARWTCGRGGHVGEQPST